MTNTADSLTTGGTKSNAQLIYILMLLGLVTGGVTSIVAVVMAYVGKNGAPDWLQTHYKFLTQTFWLWMLYGFVGLVLCIVLIGIPILIFTAVWVIVRCVQGLDYLGKDQPIPKPGSWMFAS